MQAMIRRFLPALLSLPFVTGAFAASPDSADQAAVSSRFEAIRSSPQEFSLFMRAFPKGADLHNHLVGAIYAERLLEWARADQLCVNPDTGAIGPTRCAFGFHTSKDAIPAARIMQDQALYTQTIDMLSMRNFVPSPQDRSGHDHFFATFDKFLPATSGHDADILVDALSQAARDHVTYVELMVSPQLNAVARQGSSDRISHESDIAQAEIRVVPHLNHLVRLVREETDTMERKARATMKCGTGEAAPGCHVAVRYLYQTIRTMPPGMVLAQIAFGYMLSTADSRFVGINIVGPEDNPIAMQDYTLHMQMFHTLSERWPKVKLSLHAGELSKGLVAPSGLDDHIRQAVEIAGASRIGHGVDIMQERDPYGLLTEMAQRNILVEINLSSNEQILDVKDNAHPFMTYREHGVPVALSTDDEGVSRITLTDEYLRAAKTYALSYADLKDLSRMGLEHGFVSGKSLWDTTRPFHRATACADVDAREAEPEGLCRELLTHSQKARLQWTLENQFSLFEHQVATGQPLKN